MVSALDRAPAGALRYVLGQNTLLWSKCCLSTQMYKWVPANCRGNLTECCGVTCDGLHAAKTAVKGGQLWGSWVCEVGSRDGTVARALASHQCGPRSITRPGYLCWLSLLLVLSNALRVFLRVLRFSFLYKNQHFQIPIQPGKRTRTKTNFSLCDFLSKNSNLLSNLKGFTSCL